MNWLRSHIHPVLLFLGAVAVALKPVFMGTTSYGVTGWISVALLIAGAFQSYIAPNLYGASLLAKNVDLVLMAGLSAALNVAPNGFSRQDIWTIGTALVVVAIPLLLPSTATKVVPRPFSVVGQDGDGLPAHLN